MKGFTLVELLIVVVIVGVLVAVALPKYQRSVERGRAMLGVANLRAATDYANARYLVKGAYPSSIPEDTIVANDFFEDLTITETPSSRMYAISMARKSSSGWNYTLVSQSIDGEIVNSMCTGGPNNSCTELGLSGQLIR